jgi:GPH family glycoside/pentoside/hexuronide:cation symporter
MTNKPQKLGLFPKLMFTLGQTGWALTSFGAAQLIAYYYLPPDTGKEMFPSYIKQDYFFGVFTIVGIITALCYLLSSLAEPYIANWSESSTLKFGRRRPFLAIAVIPFALFSLLIFFPIYNGEGIINGWWLFGVLALMYFFMALYVTPFNALINEIAHNDEERLSLVMFISIGFALGYGIGGNNQLFLGLLEKNMPTEMAFRWIVGSYALLGFLLMLLPVIFIDEHKYCIKNPPNIITLKGMLEQVWGNENFKTYAFVELLVWVPNTMFMLGGPYFVTTLLFMPKENTSFALIIVGVISFLLYGIIGKMALKYGNKRLILIALVFLVINFAFLGSLGWFELPLWVLLTLFIILNAFPIAVFGIIPMALTGDIASHDGEKTGIYKNAAFYGMKSFMMKIGIALSQLIFPSLLLLGKTRENDLGIRMVAFVSLAFCIVAFILMLKYKEPVKINQPTE